MKMIGTFRVKVHSSTDKKKLSTGKTEQYMYGSVSLRNPKLTEYIGQEVIVKVIIDDNK
jgi:hypothetical protein